MVEVKEDDLQVTQCGQELALFEQMTVADSFFVLFVYATEQLSRHFNSCVRIEFRLKVIFLIKSGLLLQVKTNRGELHSEVCIPESLTKKEKNINNKKIKKASSALAQLRKKILSSYCHCKTDPWGSLVIPTAKQNKTDMLSTLPSLKT